MSGDMRQLGAYRYLYLDADYEKSRQGDDVRDVTIFPGLGINAHGRRRSLGVFTALSEAKFTDVNSLRAWSKEACAGSNLSQATTIQASRPPAAPCPEAPPGKNTNSTSLKTPFTTPQRSPSASAYELQTRSSEPSSRNSNDISSRPASSPIMTCFCTWSRPSSSRSTKPGRLQVSLASTGTTRMLDPVITEFPDFRLRNQAR